MARLAAAALVGLAAAQSDRLQGPCEPPNCDTDVCQQSELNGQPGCTVCTARVCGSLQEEAKCLMRTDCKWIAEPTDGVSDKCRSQGQGSVAPCVHRTSQSNCAEDSRCEWRRNSDDTCTLCQLKHETDSCSHRTAQVNCEDNPQCQWDGSWCSEKDSCSGRTAQSNCEENSMCQWDGSSCRTKSSGTSGGSDSCSRRTAQSNCEENSMCQWDGSSCSSKSGGSSGGSSSGGGDSCSHRTAQSNCEENSMCQWDGSSCRMQSTSGSSSGGTDSCSHRTAQSNCQANSLCQWDGSFCRMKGTGGSSSAITGDGLLSPWALYSPAGTLTACPTTVAAVAAAITALAA